MRQVIADQVLQVILQVATDRGQLRHAIYRVDRQGKAVDPVFDRQLQRRGDAAEFAVAMHMQVSMIAAPVSELVNQRRIAMEVENDRPISGEETVEVAVGK